MKIFVDYDKNGNIVAAMSPAEEFEDNISIEPEKGHTILELKLQDILKLSPDAGNIKYETIQSRQRQITRLIREQFTVDVERKSIKRRQDTS